MSFSSRETFIWNCVRCFTVLRKRFKEERELVLDLRFSFRNGVYVQILLGKLYKRQCFSYLFSCFQIRIQNYKKSLSVECVNQLGRIGKEEIGRMSVGVNQLCNRKRGCRWVSVGVSVSGDLTGEFHWGPDLGFPVPLVGSTGGVAKQRNIRG